MIFIECFSEVRADNIVIFQVSVAEKRIKGAPQGWFVLFWSGIPDGYHSEAVSDGYYDGFMGKIYPAPSWPEDRK